ncbi:hypothetical protein ACFVTC_20555 [Streptomyces sp. NPDC057950]|uniref:hypothetical protein n=1 Tax=Streptomyces sp. NPDC057950 TaxID=3346288 RepID=UPI0036EFF5F1
MERSPLLCRSDRKHLEWYNVRTFLRCTCSDADPAACTGQTASGTDAGLCGSVPAGHCCPCHRLRTEAEYREIRAAVAARELNSSQVLHDFSTAAGRSRHPDGRLWAQVLTWASARIQGGRDSMHADQDFADHFGTHPYRAGWAQSDPAP